MTVTFHDVVDAIDHVYYTRWSRQKDGERTRDRALQAYGYIQGLPPERWRGSIVRGMREAGLSGATTNRALAALSSALRAAYDDGILETCGPRLARCEEGPGRERIPTRDEVAAILCELRRCYNHVARVVRYLFRTGCRRGELLGLTVGDTKFRFVHPVGGSVVLQLRETKSGIGRDVPLPASCSAWVVRSNVWGADDRKRVFNIPPSTFSAAWREARIRAGIGRWFVPHTLRHYRATELVRAGTPVPVVSRILGHESWETTKRYTHPTEDDMREALEARR